jgi:hypothetical protein
MGPTSASLGPRWCHLSPVLRRARVATHTAGAARYPRLFKARTSRRPGTPSIGSAHDLATVVEDPAQTGSYAPGPPAPVHVLRWDPPPSAVVDLRLTLPRPARAPFGTRAWTEKMLLTDFCNRHATRAPLGSFDPRGDRRAFAPLATSDGAEPQRTSRVTTCLTARPELQPPSFTRLLVTGLAAGVPRGCGCHSILPGSRSSRAREMAPPVPGVVFRGRAEHDGL